MRLDHSFVRGFAIGLFFSLLGGLLAYSCRFVR